MRTSRSVSNRRRLPAQPPAEGGPPPPATPPSLRAGVSTRAEGLLGSLGVYLLRPASAISPDPVAAPRAAPTARRGAADPRLAGARPRRHRGAQSGGPASGPGGADDVADQAGFAAPPADPGGGLPMESARSARVSRNRSGLPQRRGGGGPVGLHPLCHRPLDRLDGAGGDYGQRPGGSTGRTGPGTPAVAVSLARLAPGQRRRVHQLAALRVLP